MSSWNLCDLRLAAKKLFQGEILSGAAWYAMRDFKFEDLKRVWAYYNGTHHPNSFHEKEWECLRKIYEDRLGREDPSWPERADWLYACLTSTIINDAWEAAAVEAAEFVEDWINSCFQALAHPGHPSKPSPLPVGAYEDFLYKKEEKEIRARENIFEGKLYKKGLIYAAKRRKAGAEIAELTKVG